MKAGGIEHYEIAARFTGSDFEYMKARHPFLDKDSLLCCAEYVTMDSVPAASTPPPASAPNDYETCKRYKVELVVPVDDQGRHTDYAGKYAGMKTDERNPVILQDMKESGMLFCQRGHRPLLPPLLALQEAHHLPGHPPVVLLGGLLQGRGLRRLRRRALGARLGHRPDEVHDPGAGRLVHQPPAPLGPAHPRVLLRRLRQACLHRRDHPGGEQALRREGLQRLV